MPDLVENDWLGRCFKHGKSCSKFTGTTAGVDELHPAGTVETPVGMQQWSRDAALQLKDAGSEGGQDQCLGAECRTVPRELAGRRQTELVRQMSPLVSIVGMLVLVQCQWIGVVQVLIMLVIAIHT